MTTKIESAYIELDEQGSAPATPASGKARLYVDSKGILRWLNDDGTTGAGTLRGTSFPGSPATNDTFYRTDRGLLYFYDGTRWLTMQQFEQNLTWFPSTTLPYTGSVANTTLIFASSRTDYGALVERVTAYASVAATNNGSNYWSMDIRYAGTAAYTFNTSAGAAGADLTFENAPATVVASPIYISQLRMTAKTGSPGALTVGGTIWYRLIG